MKDKPQKQQTMKKDAAKNDFFGIDEQRPSAHWSLHVPAVVICVIYASWVWLLNPDPYIHGDQLNIVTMVMAKEHPKNFSRDIVYSGKGADYYPFLPRSIIGTMINKFGIIGGHRVLQFAMSIIYLFSMYGVLYFLTRSVPASLLVALFSIAWRWSLGGTYWGFDRLWAVQPRSFILFSIPILFVLIWKLRNSWRLLIPFFIAGLLFNINPPSSLLFTFVIWLSLLLADLHNRDGIVRLIAAGVVFILGASPYLYTNITIRNLCAAEASSQALAERMKALQYLLSRTTWSFPKGTFTKAFVFGFSAPLFLATIGWCLRKNDRNRFDKWLVCFFILTFVGTVITHFIMVYFSTHYKFVPIFNCMRGHKDAYLVLYIYMAWSLAELLRRLAFRERFVLTAVTAAIIAIIPPYNSIEPFKNSIEPSSQLVYNVSQMKTLLRGEKIEIAGPHKYIAEVANWARKETPEDSLFLFVYPEMSQFRIYALRSIVTSYLGGGYAQFAGPRGLATWAKYQQKLEQIISTKDVSGLLELAEESAADYIIAPNNFPKAPGWVFVLKDRYWTVYQKP
jgi:hypothetical protein